MTDQQFLSTTQLARRWGYSTATLRIWRSRNKGPVWCQPAGPKGKVLYAVSAVQDYERKHGMAPKEDA